MRILSGSNLEVSEVVNVTAAGCTHAAEGEETYTFNVPFGGIVKHTLEANGSSSLALFDSGGKLLYFTNSGTAVSCWVVGMGTAAIVTSFTGNPWLGVIAKGMAQAGCSTLANRTYEDGDSWLC